MLFGVNLVMDLVVLVIVNRLCRYAATLCRLLFSATFGALWSIIVVIAPSGIEGFLNICTYILISFFMVRICAGKSKIRDILRGVMVLYAVTFMLGGIIHVLYYYTYAGWFIRQVLLKDGQLLVYIMISIVLIVFICAQLLHIKEYSSCRCKVQCEIGERKISFYGYIDTGNVLEDSLYHKPVTVVEKIFFKDVISDINDCTKVKYHMIPYSSVGCANGIMEVITVDVMYIYTEKRKVVINNALIGLTEGTLSSDGEYEALINSRLVN